MFFHYLNEQRLLAGVMVIDTGCLYSGQAGNIAEWRCMVAVFREQLYGCCQNVFTH